MSQPPVTVIVPCYNEHVIVTSFLKSLEGVLAALPFDFNVVVVNDGSTDNTLELLREFGFSSWNVRLTILNLKFNVGHQAAIYQGFIYARTQPGDYYIVMDADGEDAPAVIPELLRHRDMDIVKVVRSKRRESMVFRMFYCMYKLVFRFITGRQMNFGNFCLIRRSVLECAVFSTFSHFAAFLSRQKNPACNIMADKEARIGGRSKMGFKKLFYHAFKSFVEYGEDVLMLFLKGFFIIMAVLVLCVGNVVYQKFVAHTAILGWTSVVIIGLVNLAMICIGFFVLGLLLIHLNNKNPNSKMPVYELYADDIKESV